VQDSNLRVETHTGLATLRLNHSANSARLKLAFPGIILWFYFFKKDLHKMRRHMLYISPSGAEIENIYKVKTHIYIN
jgi:hypothetical protein